MGSKKKTIFILHKHDGESQTWNRIDEKELEEWLNKYGIEEGDLIIYPKEIKICKTKKIIVKEESKNAKGS